MFKVLISGSIVLLTTVCGTDGQSRHDSAANSFNSNLAVPKNVSDRKVIENTVGVVVLDEFAKGDFVRIYNADGTLWYEFSYFYDDKDGRFEYTKDDFSPFAFHQDHFLLALKCIKTGEMVFEVVVNEETGLIKYVKANDPVLKLQSWDKFVLTVYAVSFDPEANPIRLSPGGQRRHAMPAESVFRPVAIDGDWLKIRWDASAQPVGRESEDNRSGWIRWKDDGKIVVNLAYFA